jgi:lipopolysaccharide biosynthesis glycosyltransferase
MIPIFIGYDTKETVAYHVCSNSIIRRASQPIGISPLAINTLNYAETHNDSSNQFVYTRFLVPHLMNYNGWAIFVDGDMILRDDIVKLWDLRDDTKAVMVVKHNYETKTAVKYLGSKNENYPRKNWSSVVLWNCSHPANQTVIPEFIKHSTGSELHRFSWLADELIGELPIEWNWLADEFGDNQNAKLVHYTLGTPCFKEFQNSPMSAQWYAELFLTNYYQNNS